MGSPGEIFRLARERQGRPLEDVAEEIKVSPHYLEAIEEGDLSRLPGGFFTRSFVRQYARALSIPSQQVETELEKWLAEAAPPESPSLAPRTMDTGLSSIIEVAGGRRRGRNRLFGAVTALVVVVGGCAVLYSFWLQRTAKRPEADIILTAAAPARESTPPVGQTGGIPGLGKPADATPGLSTASTPKGPLWFEISARDTTWVRVKTADETLFEGILEPGETRRFEGLSLATMRVGNAGGLALTVNGRPFGPLGPPGHIRTVTLTPHKTEVSVPPPTRPAGLGERQMDTGQGEEGPE